MIVSRPYIIGAAAPAPTPLTFLRSSSASACALVHPPHENTLSSIRRRPRSPPRGGTARRLDTTPNRSPTPAPPPPPRILNPPSHRYSSPPSSPARGGTSPTPRGSARARDGVALEPLASGPSRTDTPPRRSSRRGSGGPPAEPTRTRRRSVQSAKQRRGREVQRRECFFEIAPPLRLARADISSGAPRAPASPPPRR